MDNTERVVVMMPKELKDKLAAAAKAYNMPVSVYIRYVVTKHLAGDDDGA